MPNASGGGCAIMQGIRCTAGEAQQRFEPGMQAYHIRRVCLQIIRCGYTCTCKSHEQQGCPMNTWGKPTFGPQVPAPPPHTRALHVCGATSLPRPAPVAGSTAARRPAEPPPPPCEALPVPATASRRTPPPNPARQQLRSRQRPECAGCGRHCREGCRPPLCRSARCRCLSARCRARQALPVAPETPRWEAAPLRVHHRLRVCLNRPCRPSSFCQRLVYRRLTAGGRARARAAACVVCMRLSICQRMPGHVLRLGRTVGGGGGGVARVQTLCALADRRVQYAGTCNTTRMGAV